MLTHQNYRPWIQGFTIGAQPLHGLGPMPKIDCPLIRRRPDYQKLGHGRCLMPFPLSIPAFHTLLSGILLIQSHTHGITVRLRICREELLVILRLLAKASDDCQAV